MSKEESINEWEKITERSNIIYKIKDGSGFQKIVLEKEFGLYTLVFVGTGAKLFYQDIEKNELLKPCTKKGKVYFPDIRISKEELQIFLAGIKQDNPTVFGKILNTIYDLAAQHISVFESLKVDLNKELESLGITSITEKSIKISEKKDSPQDKSSSKSVCESLLKLSLMSRPVETKVIDVTDPNLEPASKPGMKIHSDFYACFYYERKIIKILSSESITIDQFKEARKLIQADFTSHSFTPNFSPFAKDIWSKINKSMKYSDFIKISASIREEILKRLAGDKLGYTYKTNHNHDAPLLLKDMKALGPKIKKMLKEIVLEKRYFDAKDLFVIEQKNKKDKQELLRPVYISDRAYLEQEQDQPAGWYNTIIDIDQYKACEQCEKDLDVLKFLLLKTRFMIETIEPDRIKQREVDITKLMSFYAQRKENIKKAPEESPSFRFG
jgi:hypothetical protein